MDSSDQGVKGMVKRKAPEAAIRYAVFLKKTNTGIQKIYVFGSFAKGTSHDNSDIDMAIIFGSSHKSVQKLGHLKVSHAVIQSRNVHVRRPVTVGSVADHLGLVV